MCGVGQGSRDRTGRHCIRGATVASSAGPSGRASFKASTSSGEGARRSQSIGDSSGSTVTGNSWLSEEEDGDTPGDSGAGCRRPSAPFSIGAGICSIDRFLIGRGGGVRDLGAGKPLRSRGATKRRFLGATSARLFLSLLTPTWDEVQAKRRGGTPETRRF